MDMNDREGVLGEIRDGGERHRLIYNLTNTQRLAKPGVPALTRCHFNSSRRLHQNTDKRQNSSHCKGSRKLFTTAWTEINVIRELQYNHTCFITAHNGSASICEKTPWNRNQTSVAFCRWFPTLRRFIWWYTTNIWQYVLLLFLYQIVYLNFYYRLLMKTFI